jgi:hypothetical protein
LSKGSNLYLFARFKPTPSLKEKCPIKCSIHHPLHFHRTSGHVQCSMLKSPTPVKCHFGRQRRLFFSRALHKNVLCKVKASPNIAYRKIQWLQFANRNIIGLQSWHSSRCFQISIILAILNLQLRLGTYCNFGLASTTNYM